jgi:tetratricopeptide (TPR) repeat protein
MIIKKAEGRRQKPIGRHGRANASVKVRCFLWFILPFLIFSAFSIAAEPKQTDDPQDLFDRAGRFYEAEQYDEAIKTYTLFLKQGLESGSLYYNLGNCFLKKGEMGRAILNYERAKRLIPLDSDLDSNARVARSLVRNSPSEAPGIRIAGSMEQCFDWISIDGLALLLSILYGASIVILTSTIFFQTSRRRSKAWLLLLALAFILCAFGLDRKISLLGQEAIITARTAEARYQPFDLAPTHFILDEGNRIRILRSSKEWSKVKRTDQKVGWVKTASLERI